MTDAMNTSTSPPTIAAEIERLRHLPSIELAGEYEKLFGRPPRTKHREWLFRRCAHELQIQRLGGLSDVAKRRLDELIAEIEIPMTPAARTVRTNLEPAKSSKSPALPVGTVLQRRWKDREITVRVTPEGFEHDGAVYPTLTAAVRGITGANWNAKLWFGLSPRSKREKEST
jgi:DUF2924 family protein